MIQIWHVMQVPTDTVLLLDVCREAMCQQCSCCATTKESLALLPWLYKLYSTLDNYLEMPAMQLLRTPEKKVWQCHSALYNHLRMSAMQLLHIPEKYELNYTEKEAEDRAGDL